MSLICEKVMSREVLAKGMSRDFVSMRVKASEGVLHKAKRVGDVVDILQISGKFRAWESSFSPRASGSLFLVAKVNWTAQVARVSKRRVSVIFFHVSAEEIMPESLSCMSNDIKTVLASQSL